jgi:hypothetical protein
VFDFSSEIVGEMVFAAAQKFYELWMRLKRGARFRSALEKRSFLTQMVSKLAPLIF